MANKTGKIVAAPSGDGAGKDTSLPDPTRTASRFLFGCTVLALLLALLLDAEGWTTRSFSPSRTGTADFALFAGFYVAAQVIERLMELISPAMPFWGLPPDIGSDEKVKAAQVKADRAKAALGVAVLAGVGASAGFGLYFLSAVGMSDMPREIDIFFTAITIAAGTKPLHDFTTSLQNKNSPATGTRTTVD
jgi:hypothetical protein